MALRIVVDLDLCQGHGVCEFEAPEVFEVRQRRARSIVLDASPADAPAQRRRAGREVLPDPCPVDRRRVTDSDRGPHARIPDVPNSKRWSSVGSQANRDAEAAGDWTADGRAVHRGRHLRLELRP